MLKIQNRIDQKLKRIAESLEDSSWKDPNSPNYDRQWAEDALYHTIGPLTDHPQWASQWTSKSEPVPGFNPNGPAPRWTPEEVVIAFAGDPNLLFGGSGNPKSPAYGNQGGSPLYRVARRVSRIYARDKDPSFIADMYSNGFIPLVRLMQPGFDEGRSPFISFVIRHIQGAMEQGVGGTEEGIRAAGGESTSGLVGLRGAMESNDPAKIRKIADQVKGKYQQQKSHDKHPDNPFGAYSSRFYQVLHRYADALESANEDQIEAARNHVQQLMDTIEDESTPIRGAATGMGQAISTPDRTSHVGVSSIDVERKGGDGSEGSMAGNISTDEHHDSFVDPESVYYVLSIALEHDIGKSVGYMPKYQKMARDFGAKPEADGKIKIGGKLTANELRYIIRYIGPLGSNYPGSGKPRAAVNIPRDANGWWKPGEDPEIEPIPTGGIWTSKWKREGFEQMGPVEISQEMTSEIREFERLGIKTARTVKPKIDSRTGRDVAEAVSKVAVSNAAKSALLKLQIISKMHRTQLGLEESRILRNNNIPLLEDLDAVDRRIIIEACDFIIRKLQRAIIECR